MSEFATPVADLDRATRRRGRSARRGVLAGILCVGVVAPASLTGPLSSTATASPTTPNIVVILTDDQPKGMLATMPFLQSNVLPVSTRYEKAVVPTSVCCPSRSSLLTGRYSNETGVFGINPAKFGGYKVFQQNGNQNNTVAVKLAGKGYATGLFGKYLNGYRIASGESRPPGWNRWNAITEGPAGGNKYTNYEYTADAPGLALEDTENAPSYPTPSAGQYSTTQMGDAATGFIDEVPAGQPLFAMYTPYAPHAPFTPEPKYAGSGVAPSWKKIPSAEKDVKDKPRWVQKQPKKIRMHGMAPREVWRKQTAVLRSVDDQVANIVSALKRTGRWDNTLLVYTSDNGYAYGQNQLTQKNNPYRPSSEVDLFVKYPYQNSMELNRDLVTPNVDVAATVLAAAGHTNTTSGLPLGSSGERAGIPMMASWTRVRARKRPPYCGWRTKNELFIRYGSKEEEYYNYATDPGGKKNLLRIVQKPPKGKPAAPKTPLTPKEKKNATRAAALRSMAAAACTNLSPDFGPSFSKPTWKYKY